MTGLFDTPTDEWGEIRAAVRRLCLDFPGDYWRALDRDARYPADFVRALTEAGWLAALIPEDYGGAGLPLSATTRRSGAGCRSWRPARFACRPSA